MLSVEAVKTTAKGWGNPWRTVQMVALGCALEIQTDVLSEVPRVLFLGLCLVFHYFSTGVVFPKIGFYFSRRAVAQALVEP
ncbi:hypothetical protein ACOI9V_12630, partial [Corynebacterium striatum]|uniref:hypothetical protein n=1 Tax=Corynebacterium striatum TaxID=43770 RepID=UPI003B5A5C44